MKVIKASLVLFLSLFVLSLSAQNRGTVTITGNVTDPQGSPLTGVTIVDKNNPAVGTVSDIEGDYSINIESGTVLEFSYIGFTSQEVLVSKSERSISSCRKVLPR